VHLKGPLSHPWHSAQAGICQPPFYAKTCTTARLPPLPSLCMTLSGNRPSVCFETEYHILIFGLTATRPCADQQARGDVDCSRAAYPNTYAEFWSQLLSGKLKWRWHYTIYLALVGNTIWQIVRIFTTHSEMMQKSHASALFSTSNMDSAVDEDF
jgi:hypothetical protein